MNGKGTYDAESKVCRVTSCSGPPAVTPTVPLNFTCSAVGLFADPTNCHNFYSCDAELNPILGTCMKGQGTFDPVNRVCSPENCSNSEAFVCPSSGFFADPEDCHNFYVCDQHLNAVRSSCTAKAHFDPQLICVIGPCVLPTTTTVAPTPVADTPFKCSAKGYFADPKDCHSYYICDTNLNADHRVCMGGGGYYNPVTSGCYFGIC
jgi:hypothetical protein